MHRANFPDQQGVVLTPQQQQQQEAIGKIPTFHDYLRRTIEELKINPNVSKDQKWEVFKQITYFGTRLSHEQITEMVFDKEGSSLFEQFFYWLPHGDGIKLLEKYILGYLTRNGIPSIDAFEKQVFERYRSRVSKARVLGLGKGKTINDYVNKAVKKIKREAEVAGRDAPQVGKTVFPAANSQPPPQVQPPLSGRGTNPRASLFGGGGFGGALAGAIAGAQNTFEGFLAPLGRRHNHKSSSVQQHTDNGDNHRDDRLVLAPQAGIKPTPTAAVNNAGGASITAAPSSVADKETGPPIPDDNHGTIAALVPYQNQTPLQQGQGLRGTSTNNGPAIIPTLGNNAAVFPPPNDLNGMLGRLHIDANTTNTAVDQLHLHAVAVAAAANGGGGGGGATAPNATAVVNNSGGGVVNITNNYGTAPNTTAPTTTAPTTTAHLQEFHDKLDNLQSTLNDQGGLVREIHDHTTGDHVHVYEVPKNTSGGPCGHCKAKMFKENSKTAFCSRPGHGSEQRGFVEWNFGKVLSE